MTKYSESISQKIGITDKSKFKECVENNKFYSPLFVKIKPLGKCNLKCKKCNYWRRDSHMLHPGLSKEKILSLVSELKDLGCRCIKLSGGEITLLKELLEIVKYIKSKNIICSITSNGILINKNLAKALVSVGLDKITISIDSHISEIHDEIVGVRGAWKKSINAIEYLINEKRAQKSKLRITVATVLTKENYRDLDKTLDLLNKLKINRWDLLVLVSDHLEDKSLSMSKKDINFFNEKILPKINKKSKKFNIKLINPDPFRSEFGENYENIPENLYKKIPCCVGWYSFLIHFNGMVALCCANKEFEIGNVNKTKLRDILNNKKSILFRQIQKTKNKPKNCLKCFDEILNNIQLNKWIEEK